MSQNITFIFLTFLTLEVSLAQSLQQGDDVFYPLETGIAMGSKGKVASDLIYNGKALTTRDAIKLKELAWDGKFDLSTLDPEEFTYWSNKYVLDKDLEESNVRLKDNDVSEFLEQGSLGDNKGTYIHVSHADQIYQVIMRPENYRSLMMRTLLRKIGYFVPSLKKINRVKVNFESADQKQTFLDHYNENHNFEIETEDDDEIQEWVEQDKWIFHNPQGQNWVILQDVVLRNITDGDYTNLSLEPRLDKEIKNRRTFSSLLIPYSILNYSGSTNAFEWWSGKIISQNIFMDYPEAVFFDMSYEDGRWMTRRLSKLTRSDWDDVVRSSQLPGTIQKVLLEKVMARYNSTVDLFQLNSAKLKVDYKVSDGVKLEKGKLRQCHWDGFAISFCDADKDNPIGRSDLWEFIKSKAFSVGIDSIMGAINSLPIFSTDIAGNNSSIIENAVSNAITRFDETGEEENLLMKRWNFGYHNYNIILSRNLVTGRYQGSDQLVSLVHSAGVSLGVGKYFAQMGYNEFLRSDNLYQREGNFSGINVSPISLKVGGRISRVYSHVQPVLKIKDSNKNFSFKEFLVFFVKKGMGRIFNETKDENKKEISRAEVLATAKKNLQTFKERLNVGESFIITDTLGGGGVAGVSASYQKLVELGLGGGLDGSVINRLHIIRASENKLHVYKNFGNLLKVSFNAQLAALSIPVFRFYKEKIPGGRAQTDFFTIDLDENSPGLIDNVLAIRSLFVSGSLRPLRKIKKPVKLKFKYDQNLTKIGVFWFNYNSVNSNNNIQITTPEDDKQEFLRFYDAHSNGKNIAHYGAEVLEFLIKKKLDFNVPILGSPLNSGLSITGKSKNTQVVYEVELSEENEMTNQFAHYTYSRNGWESNREDMEKMVGELEKRFNYDYFLENPLYDVKSVRVYHLAADFFIYNKGIEHMFSLDEQRLKKVFALHSQDFVKSEILDIDNFNRIYHKYKSYKKKYEKNLKKKKWKKLSRNVSDTIKFMTKNLTLTGLSMLWGGSGNFYTYASLNGFREGVEQKGMDYESSVQSNSFGTLGEFFVKAPRDPNHAQSVPLSMLEENINMGKWGMTRGELYLNWILGRIY